MCRVRALLTFLLASVTACASFPSDLPRESACIVAVKSARLPGGMPWYTRFAEHGWIDFLLDGEWHRAEALRSSAGTSVIDAETARSNRRWHQRDVHVLARYTGQEARRIARRILAIGDDYPDRDNYNAYPGPNSNTYLEWLGQNVPGLWFEQYPTALGKDYPRNGWIRAGITTTRTGIELETPYLGIEAGVADGIEIHVLGLQFGVDLWPPQIELPFLPGIPWGFFRL